MAEITVHLGGRLGILFGKEWRLNVASPAEALRAIDINTKGGFRRYLSKDTSKEYHICIGSKTKEGSIGKDELKSRSGQSDIYVLPAIKGRNSGWFKIIAGVILIIVGAIIDYYTGGGGNVLIGFGASLVFGGITQLLTSAPKQNQQLQSFNFQGNASTAYQGSAVPVFYGRYLISPIPICVSFSAQNAADFTGTINGGGQGIVGDVNQTQLPGGGTQYDPGEITNPSIPAPGGFVPYDPDTEPELFN
jgi:predicted phage tail protein